MALTRRAFSASLLPSLALSQSRAIDERVVFAAGEGDYHTFRIPALLPDPDLACFSHSARADGSIGVIAAQSTS